MDGLRYGFTHSLPPPPRVVVVVHSRSSVVGGGRGDGDRATITQLDCCGNGIRTRDFVVVSCVCVKRKSFFRFRYEIILKEPLSFYRRTYSLPLPPIWKLLYNFILSFAAKFKFHTRTFTIIFLYFHFKY